MAPAAMATSVTPLGVGCPGQCWERHGCDHCGRQGQGAPSRLRTLR